MLRFPPLSFSSSPSSLLSPPLVLLLILLYIILAGHVRLTAHTAALPDAAAAVLAAAFSSIATQGWPRWVRLRPLRCRAKGGGVVGKGRGRKRGDGLPEESGGGGGGEDRRGGRLSCVTPKPISRTQRTHRQTEHRKREEGERVDVNVCMCV